MEINAINQKNQIEWVSSLRGLGCLIVLTAHILASQWGAYFSGCGKIGVWLLFILSAFLIEVQFNYAKPYGMKEMVIFWIKRIFRIYPCYICVLLLALVFGFFDKITEIGQHILLLKGNWHFWTIPVEMIFYLIVPFILVILKNIRNLSRYGEIGLLLIFSIVLAVIAPFTSYEENSIFIVWYLPVFFLGMILGNIYKKNIQVKKTISYLVSIVAFLCCAALIIAIPIVRFYIFGIAPNGYLQNKYLFVSFVWASVIIAIIYNNKWKKAFELNRIFIWIGEISYPLYLTHYLILIKISEFELPFIIKVIIVVGSSILLSLFLHYTIEMPFVNIGKKITNFIKKI